MTYDRDIVTEFLRESNAIEGVFDEKCLAAALDAWDYLMTKDEMTLAVVRQTHQILMRDREAWDDDMASVMGLEGIGRFRTMMVYIGNKPALNAVKIEEYLENWCASMNSEGLRNVPDHVTDPPAFREQNSRSLHIEYELIHPFMDGNGRTGRMFMNWWRLKANLPLLVIHVGDEQMAYYKWFEGVSIKDL